MLRTIIPALALAGAANVAAAQEVEQYDLQDASVSVILHPFLTADEAAILRTVGQSPEALELFVPETGRYAALAVAPDEGFVRDGIPVESAVAIGDLPDLEEARAAALEGCNAVRNGGEECAIVLEVTPQ